MSELQKFNQDKNINILIKPVVTIKNLNFSYDKGKPNITGLDCVIHANSKVILVGANGAGKSTLLRILCGSIFMGLKYDEFDINGSHTPNDQSNGVVYLGGVWKRRRTGFEGICPYTMDIAARDMMSKWQEEYQDRRDELVRVMGINLDWRMHECSDGQRKKVRIMIKLLRPFRLCVIDEFLEDLDIFTRKRFLNYLSEQCSKFGAVVIYATHIFDQTDNWASHIAFMKLDKTLSPIYELKDYPPYQEILARTGSNRAMCPMCVMVYEELERQYKLYSSLFTNSQCCITDINVTEIITESQCNEKASDIHMNEKEADQSGWVSGRLARNIAIDSISNEKKKIWMAKQDASNKVQSVVKDII